MLQLLPITELQRGYNPRKNLRITDEFQESIKQEGVLVPLLVRPVNGHYEIVSGHRRFETAKKVELTELPCVIRDLTDEQAFHLSYIDNKDRANLNPLEEAEHFKQCQTVHKMTVRQIGERYHLGKSTVSDNISILSLPRTIQENLSERSDKFQLRHGYEITKLCHEGKLKKTFEENAIFLGDEWESLFEKELEYRRNLQTQTAQKVIDDEISVKKLQSRIKELKKDLKDRDDDILELIENGRQQQQVLDGIYFKSCESMEEIEDESMHLVITSPPYFANKEYEQGTSFQEYQNLLKSVLFECSRVLVPGCRCCINLGDIPNVNGARYPASKLILENKPESLIFKDLIIWKKDDPWQSNLYITHSGREGQYRILPSTENIFILLKEGKREVSETQKIQGGVSIEEWAAWVSGLWSIPSVRKNDDHPAKFPEELPLRLIKMFSFPGDNVLDPFLGSGTTIKVSRTLERHGFGYEKEMQYKAVIEDKLTDSQ